MMPWPPLWAIDIGQIIGIIVFLLVVVVPAIAQMLNKARLQQQQRRGGGPPPNAPQGVQAGGRQANVEDDIGEFLRRAAERRGGAAAAEPPPPVRQPPVREQPLVVAEVAEDAPLGGQLREHVGEYLDSSKFQRRASELGDEVAQADELIERRLHQKFDHEVGRLSGRPGESAFAPRTVEALEPEDRTSEFPPTAAVGVAAMLRDVDSIRQAIIISEILNRPLQRWT